MPDELLVALEQVAAGGGLRPKTLQVRCGCEGGGKGALVQDDVSATLSCTNMQTLFQPVGTVVCAADDNGRAAVDFDCAGTLKVGGGRPYVAFPSAARCGRD